MNTEISKTASESVNTPDSGKHAQAQLAAAGTQQKEVQIPEHLALHPLALPVKVRSLGLVPVYYEPHHNIIHERSEHHNLPETGQPNSPLKPKIHSS